MQSIKTAGPLRSLAAFTVGVSVSVAGYLLSQTTRTGVSVLDNGELPARGPWAIRLLFRGANLFVRINSWPWIMLVFLVFASLAVLRRKDEKGWTFAFVAGAAFIGTLHEIIFRM
jgi:hypothetical protein